MTSDDEQRRTGARSGRRWARRWPDRLLLVAAFAVSRVAYAAAGVRFDASGLRYSSQLLDPTLLRDDLVRSVWYLHAQPPAFNTFVGLVLRWSPFSPETSFHLAFLACGLVLVLALHDLGRRLGLGRWAAAVVAVVVGCSPTVVLHENWLSYEYPVATMLVLVVDLAARFGRRPVAGPALACVGTATLATLSRSLLHPVWLVAVVACLVLYRWPPRRSVVLAAVGPLALVAALLLKNQVLFGSPQLSSWFGFSLHRVAVEQLTDDQRAQLAAEGFVATPAPECVVSHPDVPAVADPTKHGGQRFDGDPIENFNHECVIARYAARQADSVEVIRAHPGWYARSVAGATEIWAGPTSLTPFVFHNRQAVAPADEVYRRVVLLDVAWDPPVAIPNAWPVMAAAPDHRFHLSIVNVVATVAAVAAATVAALRWRRRTSRSLAYLVGGGTIAFVTLSSVLLEFGENNRFRFLVEPLSLVLLVALVAAAARAWRRSRGRSAEDDPDGRAGEPVLGQAGPGVGSASAPDGARTS